MTDDPNDLKRFLLFRTIAEYSRAVIGAKALDGRYIYVNDEYSRLFHRPCEEFIGKTDAELFSGEAAAAFRSADLLVQKSKDAVTVEEVVPVDGKNRAYLSVKFPIRDESGQIWATGVVATDITDRKEMETERDGVIEALQKALSEIRTLSGLLPICSLCKKIRTKDGTWEQVEIYIRDRSEAEFSHTLCPDCLDRLYPGVFHQNGKK